MENRVKKAAALFLAILFLFSVSACTQVKKDPVTDDAVNDSVAAETFVITNNDGMIFVQGQRGSFTVNDVFEHFQSVSVDGKELTEDDFYVSSGPMSEGGFIQLTLLENYLSSLDVGEHKVIVVTKDGQTEETLFTVAEADTSPEEEKEDDENKDTEEKENGSGSQNSSGNSGSGGNSGSSGNGKSSGGSSGGSGSSGSGSGSNTGKTTAKSDDDDEELEDYVPLSDAEMYAMVNELENYAASLGYIVDHTLGLDNGSWGSAYLFPVIFTADTKQEQVDYFKRLIRENEREKEEGDDYPYVHMRVVLYKDSRCNLPGEWMMQDVYYGWFKTDPAFPIDLVRHKQKRIYNDDGSWTSKPIYGTAYHFVNGWKESISEDLALEYTRAYEIREYGYFFEDDYLNSFVYD